MQAFLWQPGNWDKEMFPCQQKTYTHDAITGSWTTYGDVNLKPETWLKTSQTTDVLQATRSKPELSRVI